MRKNRTVVILTLILAGEAIFFLPFVMARIFRPSLLVLFGIDNRELGSWFALYGVIAMLSYFLGGPLADRFQPRKLMSLALFLTAAGGMVMLTLPGNTVMRLVYAFWGFSTICLFWSALIRSTRNWGGELAQGRAFGWLEGGRGAMAATLGTLSLFVFSRALLLVQPAEAQGFQPFQWVILFTSLFTFSSGIMVWLLVPDQHLNERKDRRPSFRIMLSLLRKPSSWYLSALIICAYAGYKISDDFSLLAREVLHFSEQGAAAVGSSALWLRALTAIAIGFLGDRFPRPGIIMFCFGLTALSALATGAGILPVSAGPVLVLLGFSALGIYGVRTLYFAILEEAGIGQAETGAAVGLVSFLGFSPEIFMSPWMGSILDNNPGLDGHQKVFLLLSAFAFVGLLCSCLFRRFANS